MVATSTLMNPIIYVRLVRRERASTLGWYPIRSAVSRMRFASCGLMRPESRPLSTSETEETETPAACAISFIVVMIPPYTSYAEYAHDIPTAHPHIPCRLPLGEYLVHELLLFADLP